MSTVPRSYFLTTTASRYHSQKKRVFEFYGIVLELPFTLDQYREWILAQLGTEDGTVRCAYCGSWLNFQIMQTDHRTPLAQGGSLELENLCACCEPCNQQKGAMRAEAFETLLELAKNRKLFTQIDRDNLLGRLQIAMKLAKKQQAQYKRNVQSVRLNPAGRIREAR